MAIVNLAVADLTVDRVDASNPPALASVLAEDSRARARTEIRIAGETHGQVLVLDRVVQAVVRLFHERLGVMRLGRAMRIRPRARSATVAPRQAVTTCKRGAGGHKGSARWRQRAPTC